jgi:plasmid stabilization system protein ParE
MKVEFSKRAAADIQKVGTDSRRLFGDDVAAMLEARFRKIFEQIGELPDTAPNVEGRAGVHVLPLIRYPYKVFYRVFPDKVRILHIRHTSRRPW